LDLTKIIEMAKRALALIFGSDSAIPRPFLVTLGVLILLAVLVYAVYGLAYAASKIGNLWTDDIKPKLYNHHEKQRSVRRRYFADHIEREMRRLDAQEDWRDYRFADLEAEVESEASRRWTILGRSRGRGPRREKSLARALTRSDERLILLEGDPGAGKSVALRHLARDIAGDAMKSKNVDSLVPLYVNLKGLQRPPGDLVDRNLIEKYVRKVLNRNDRAIEEFLDQELVTGLQRGAWLFLFDSFDEIPEVLSSVDADTAVRDYALAINDFLGGLNQCRGIVASREFRGPRRLGWPRFHILTMPPRVQRRLIQRADMDVTLARTTYGNLIAGIDPEITAMAGNPLFLGLLCEYMRTGGRWPSNAHVVFEAFVNSRLTRDTDKLLVKFRLKPDSVRRHAEHIAFCMAADPEVSLSPKRKAVRQALTRAKLASADHNVMDALEFMKLARSENDATGDERSFAFAHRRFQEYFATSVVLREPVRVNNVDLLMNARWRETAVVMLQTQSDEVVTPLVRAAEVLLDGMIQSLGGADVLKVQDDTHPSPSPVEWPVGAIHLLGLLQAGLARRPAAATNALRHCAAQLLVYATARGTLLDRKWALEVAGIVSQAELLNLIQGAFNDGSSWLRDVAYRQVARLSAIGDEAAMIIRTQIIETYRERRLRKDRDAIYAHLNRLAQPSRFIPTFNLLLLVPLVDGMMLLLITTRVAAFGSGTATVTLLALALAAVGYLTLPEILGFARHFRRGRDQVVSLVSASITISLRLSVLMLLLRNRSWPNILLAIGLLWPIAALVCAHMRQTISPLFWPILPVWLLGVSCVATARWLRRARWSDYRGLLALAVGVTGLAAIAFVLFTYFPKATPGACAAFGFIFLMNAAFRALRYRMHDFLMVRRGKLRGGHFNEADELLMLIAALGRPAKKAEILRAVRDQNRLDMTEANERCLREAALNIEIHARTESGRPKLLGNYQPTNLEVLDELNMLAEQIQVLRGV
jgi:hypothetical protein